jgi:hypothetical protein
MPARDRDRDRDADGRPRNARPRDRLGRPLPPGSADERLTPTVPADSADLLELAQQLLDAGRPFEAHEVLEEQWKRADPHEAALWRALAQLCVAYTHHLRGNASGAQALAERSGRLLATVTAAPPFLDLPGALAYARTLHDDPGALTGPPQLLR